VRPGVLAEWPLLLLQGSDLDWGNAPSWAAVIAGSTAAVFAGRNVLVNAQDRRHRQAERVAARLMQVTLPP
jgi:hypothetical protein